MAQARAPMGHVEVLRMGWEGERSAIMERIMGKNLVECFSLSELKQRAKAEGYTEIKRRADGAHAVPIDDWNGVSTESGSAYSHASVWYNLDGNTVIVHKTGEPDIYYDLSETLRR